MNVTERVDVLLVGGGVASVRCARTLRRNRFDGSILLVSAEAAAPYNRPPLSKELLREDLPDELVLAEAEGWYARRNVALRLGSSVAELDADARRVTLDDGSSIEFGRCLLATGAEPRGLRVEGGEGALLLRTLPDARRLRAAAVDAGPGAPATIIGGGFIGIEVASALAALGLRPRIVEMADRLWGGTLGSELALWAIARLEEVGVTFRLGAAVTRLDPERGWIADEPLEHALAVAGIGVTPRVWLAEQAGLAVADGILTDEAQRTSRRGIWAAGDVASVAGDRVEHWHAAREAGERAGLSMLGLPVPAKRPAWVFSEVAGTPIDVIGDAAGWDEERWTGDGSVLAYLDGGRVVQLAIINSALDAEVGRRVVASGASVEALEEALAG